MNVTENDVLDALRHVKDPEIRLGIVDLGLVYGVDIDEEAQKVTVKLTLTSPMCPYGPQLIEATRAAAVGVENVKDADVEIVWDPPWDPRLMASDEAKDILGIW
jgi:metal-sulfur cluster biosynthetic enzyme